LAPANRRHNDVEPAVEIDSGPARVRHDGLRLCAVTRQALDPDRLIRFVAGPEGVIVADLGRKLPGRGVWVTAEKTIVQRAIATHAFAKSLKRPVKAESGLADQVERLVERRVVEALAMANKAGLVTTGFEQVDELIASGGAKVLVQAADAAAGGRDKLARKFAAVARASGRAMALVTSLSTEQLSLAMGRSNVVHAALIQGGAAERFWNEAERLSRYRLGSAASGEPENAQDLEV